MRTKLGNSGGNREEAAGRRVCAGVLAAGGV